MGANEQENARYYMLKIFGPYLCSFTYVYVSSIPLINGDLPFASAHNHVGNLD